MSKGTTNVCSKESNRTEPNWVARTCARARGKTKGRPREGGKGRKNLVRKGVGKGSSESKNQRREKIKLQVKNQGNVAGIRVTQRAGMYMYKVEESNVKKGVYNTQNT